MEERRRVHQCHSQHKPLSYLHESSSNLSLHTNYIKRKEKPKLQRMKTKLNPISAWSSLLPLRAGIYKRNAEGR